MVPFFTQAGSDFFTERLNNNRTYRKANAADVADGERIYAEIYEPTNEWARQVAAQLPEYEVAEDWRWLIGGGYFKQYSWARLFLREYGDQGIYFTLGVHGEDGIPVYKMDLQRRGSDPLSPETVQRLDQMMAPYKVQWQEVDLSRVPPYTWTELVAETVQFVQQHTALFRQLHEQLTEPLTPPEEERAVQSFARKFPNPNIILYGPPGTGKTHHTLELAYELLTGQPPASYADAQLLFQEELGNRVDFVTFHQSFTYEDFVQGIKPEVNENDQLVFKRQNGIFYNIARRAREEYQRQTAVSPATRPVAFDEVFARLLEPLLVEGNEPLNLPMKRQGHSFPVIDFDGNHVTFRRGQDGHVNKVLKETLQGLYEGTLKRMAPSGPEIYHGYIVDRLHELAREQNSQDTAPSSSWEAPRNYVLIIDEINRANISKVFGELITLLEKDKRLGGANPLPVTLPSGEQQFTVPANLYVIGTMNTADKSIALLDIALRRRFEFQALYPVYAKNKVRFTHADVFEKLNKEIVRQKSRDFQIGHAYFMHEAEPLADIFNKKVIPLLYEYFLSDDKKVKDVLEKAGIPAHEDSDMGLLRYGVAG